jgi:hypothetical protein
MAQHVSGATLLGAHTHTSMPSKEAIDGRWDKPRCRQFSDADAQLTTLWIGKELDFLYAALEVVENSNTTPR